MSEPYVPFGPEWRREVLKLRKADLVDMFRDALLRLKELEQSDIEKGRAIAAAMNKPNRA